MRYVISLLVAAALVAIAVVIFALVLQPREVKQSRKTVVPVVLAEQVWTCPQRIALGETVLAEPFVLDADVSAGTTGGAYRFEKASLLTGILRTWSEEKRVYKKISLKDSVACEYRPVTNEGGPLPRYPSIAIHLADGLMGDPVMKPVPVSDKPRPIPERGWSNAIPVVGECLPWMRLSESGPVVRVPCPLPDVIKPLPKFECHGVAEDCPFHIRARVRPVD